MLVRTRFAPSPTGFLHVGGARTALFCFLFARRYGGQFILRIEDTDEARSTETSVSAILDGMAWLGLDCDEGPYYQSERADIYRSYIDHLLQTGLAYRCYCTKEELEQLRESQRILGQKPRYDGRYRDYSGPARKGVDPVIRFKNPLQGEVVINDLIRGTMTFDNAELDDLVIARADGTPTYNFTVVVDDLEMGITHVIRGDDHINNTPRQINILRALGKEPPAYAHVPMILGSDGHRLSKRHGAVAVTQFRERGYLPEALLNYLVRLGWSHGDKEVFSLAEMIDLFSLENVNRGAAAFDYDKLHWLNQHYIKESNASILGDLLADQLDLLGVRRDIGPTPALVAQAQRERAKTMREMAENSRYFYEDFDDFEEKAAKKNFKKGILETLRILRSELSGVINWRAEVLQEVVADTAANANVKLGKVAQPLRVAVCGRAVSPPIDVTLELTGKVRTLQRLDMAIAYICTNQLSS